MRARSSRTVRRIAAVALAGCVGASLLGAASAHAPAHKPAKHRTSVAVTAVTDASAATNPGGKTLSGDVLAVTGTVSKNLVGRTLRVEMNDGTRWRAIGGRATPTKARTFSVSTRVADVGAHDFRIVFAGSKTLKASSGGFAATVWKWYSLADLPRTAKEEAYIGNAPHAEDQVTVAGQTYTDVLSGTIYGARTSSADYSLGYRCSDFTTTEGLGDRSVGGSSGVFTVYRDGAQADTRTLPLGSSSDVALDTTGVFRIRLEHSAITAKDDAEPIYPSWPNARVLCSADPA